MKADQLQRPEFRVETESLPTFTPLDYDPFEGDFGDQGDRVFSDAMARARKAHTCSHCCGPILKGEEYRRRREKSDGEMRTWKWCSACCRAMVQELQNDYADDEPDEPFPFEARHVVAAKVNNEKRNAG